MNEYQAVLERIAIALEKIADKPGYVKKPAGPKLTCPSCNKSEALREDKINSDGTYYCWRKINGCGGKGFTKEQCTDRRLVDSSTPVAVIPDAVTQVFDNAQVVDHKLMTQEELYTKAATHSKNAWIYDDTPMTIEDLALLNMINRVNGWAPSRLLKCSREEASIKILNALTEDAQGNIMASADHFLDLLKSIQPDYDTLHRLIEPVIKRSIQNQTFAQLVTDHDLNRWLDDIS